MYCAGFEGLFPMRAKQCPAFLRHKMTIIHPNMLKQHGIPYVKARIISLLHLLCMSYKYFCYCHTISNDKYFCDLSINAVQMTPVQPIYGFYEENPAQ